MPDMKPLKRRTADCLRRLCETGALLCCLLPEMDKGVVVRAAGLRARQIAQRQVWESLRGPSDGVLSGWIAIRWRGRHLALSHHSCGTERA